MFTYKEFGILCSYMFMIQAERIHVSGEARSYLEAIGGFLLTERGQVEIKVYNILWTTSLIIV